MKKLSLFILSLLAALILVACGNSNNLSTEKVDSNSKVLVAYFSASGTTENVAKEIADTTGGDLFELVPTNPYSRDDLDWNDPNSRVVAEYENKSQRDTPLRQTSPDNWDDYDVVFVGYPIWWQDAAWPIDDFIKNNNFEGKTVIPFATSMSSGMGNSASNLAQMAGTGNWQEGRRFSSADSTEVNNWLKELGY